MSCGLGSLSRARSARSSSSSRMMSLHSSTHSSQTNTEGPAMSLRTSCWLLPQKEQYSSLPSSVRPRGSSLIGTHLALHAPYIACGRPPTQRSASSARYCYLAFLRARSRLQRHRHELTPLFEHVIDQAVGDRSRAVHKIVPIGIGADLLHALAGVFGEDPVEPVARAEHLLGMDLHVRGLALKATQGLVDHDARMRQCKALTGGTAREQYRPHARRLADADRAHVGFDELHGVVDRQPRADHPTGGIDIQRHILIGVLRLQKQQLCYHDIGHVIIDRTDDEDDPLLEQPRINVIRALAPGGLLDDDGNQIQATLVHSGSSYSIESVMLQIY